MTDLPEIVRQGSGPFDDWREIVRRDTGERIGWLRRDTQSSVVAWDAYTPEKAWLHGFGNQADAVRYLRHAAIGDTE